MSNWISVNDKLPKDGVDVLACSRFEDLQTIKIYCYSKELGKWHESASPGWPADNITHWMPLPDPPESQ